jgi:predicted transposase YdaD
MGYGKRLLMEGEQNGERKGRTEGRLEILNLIKAGFSTEALKELLEAELAAAESKPQTINSEQ